MFELKRFARIKRMFAEQFEPDKKGFLYRMRGQGAPIPVSAEERARFIDTFNRRLTYGAWAMLFGGMAVGGVRLFTEETDAAQSDVFFYSGLAILLIAFMAAFFLAWYAPLRALRERTPVGEPRAEHQVRHMRLSRLSYTQLFIGIAISALIPFRVEGDWMSGWNPVYLSVAAVSATLLFIVGCLKWRAAADHAADAAGPIWRRRE